VAGYDATINLRVTGGSAIDRTLRGVEQLQNIVKTLNTTPITLNTGKISDKVRTAKKEVNEFVRAVVNGTKHLANNEAALRDQASAFRQLSNNYKIGSTEFTNAIQAQVKAEQKLDFAQFDRIEAQSKLIALGRQSNTESFKGVQQLLAYGKQVKNNTASLELYKTVLSDTIQFVNYGTAEYRELAAAIGQVNVKLRAGQKIIKPGTQYGAPIGPQLPGAGARGRSPAGGAGGGAAGSAIIGGAFPLLFGQGPGAALGGAIGGGIGGRMGGEMGFGLSLVGTVFGQAIDTMIKKSSELGAALKPVTADLDTIIESLGAAGSPTGDLIKQLEELESKQVALQEATSRLRSIVGDDGVAALKEFNDATTTLTNAITQFVTIILAEAAKLLKGPVGEFAGGVANLALGAQAPQSQNPEIQALLQEAQGTQSLERQFEIRNRITQLMKQEKEQSDAALENRVKESIESGKLMKLEERRTLGRNLAEKQINAEIDSQIARHEINNKYMGEGNELLREQALKQQDIKDRLTAQGFEIEANKQRYDAAAQAIQNQVAALDRGKAVTDSRYSAEAALNNLYGAQLERQYRLAQSNQERFNLSLRMFQQQSQAAKIEYEQALNNNALLVKKAELEAKLVEIKYKQVEAEKAIALAGARASGASAEDTRAIANAYDQALGLQRETVEAAYNNVAATQEIAQNQNIVAESILKTKLLQAESQLAQKLVSDEIGLSQQQANNLAAQLRVVQENTALSNNQAQALVGSIQVGTQKTYLLSNAMGDVAANAQRAVANINAAFAAQQRLNAARAAQPAAAPQGAADGAYWPGGFKAFAEGGVVNKPTMGLVGEGGESEYIIPASKMRAAMERYASGARGSSVIPNSTGGGGGMAPGGEDMMPSINPSVNVTTGPVMNMDGANYVSQNDFVAGLQSASRRGAEMALQMLRSGGGMRKRLGVG
jgi:hypothetical protein